MARKKLPYRTTPSSIRLADPIWDIIDEIGEELGTQRRPATISVIVREVARLRKEGRFPKGSILSVTLRKL